MRQSGPTGRGVRKLESSFGFRALRVDTSSINTVLVDRYP
jgi:hypothetical protein